MGGYGGAIPLASRCVGAGRMSPALLRTKVAMFLAVRGFHLPRIAAHGAGGAFHLFLARPLCAKIR
jgi:hypothetical protein